MDNARNELGHTVCYLKGSMQERHVCRYCQDFSSCSEIVSLMSQIASSNCDLYCKFKVVNHNHKLELPVRLWKANRAPLDVGCKWTKLIILPSNSLVNWCLVYIRAAQNQNAFQLDPHFQVNFHIWRPAHAWLAQAPTITNNGHY